MILCIETATPVCSVALCSTDGVVSIRENHEKKSHAALLTVFILDMLNEQGIKASDLKAVAVSMGPGSFTGLRIGVSTAKGIAYSAGLPLIGIETTRSMFYGMKTESGLSGSNSGHTLFCPMIDARRMEVYYCLYDESGGKIRNITAQIITEELFSDIPEDVRIVFAGDGSAKCREILKRGNSLFIDDFKNSARYMCAPAYEAYTDKKFEDVAYSEPLYLKDFIATVAKKNIIA